MKTPSKYSGRKLKKPNMKQEGNFTQIPNAFILNPEIRDPELRLLQYVMMYSENRTITTKNCILYLCKSKPAISSSFEKLIDLGILKITDENIEVIIPEEMKIFKLGYLEGKENLTPEVKKTLPLELENPILEGKENLTTKVKETLPSGKENFTQVVKNSFKKPLEDVDNDKHTNSIILNNTRVVPVPAKSGSTGQPHSNGNTKGKTGIELDLECGTHQSLASPSVLAPSLHTPMRKTENGENSSLPIVNSNSSTPPIEVEKFNPIVSANFQTESESHSSITGKNDLDLVLENVEYFKLMFDNANWGKIDISNFSNADIAHLVIEKEKNNEDKSISSKTYYFLFKLIQYSSIMGNDSNLWVEFQRQCKSEKKKDILTNLTHKSMLNQI